MIGIMKRIYEEKQRAVIEFPSGECFLVLPDNLIQRGALLQDLESAQIRDDTNVPEFHRIESADHAPADQLLDPSYPHSLPAKRASSIGGGISPYRPDLGN